MWWYYVKLFWFYFFFSCYCGLEEKKYDWWEGGVWYIVYFGLDWLGINIGFFVYLLKLG